MRVEPPEPYRVVDPDGHPLGDEDRIHFAVRRLANEGERVRLWQAYDGWAFAPEAEREWARTRLEEVAP